MDKVFDGEDPFRQWIELTQERRHQELRAWLYEHSFRPDSGEEPMSIGMDTRMRAGEADSRQTLPPPRRR